MVQKKFKQSNKPKLSNKGIITCQNDKLLPLFSFAHITRNSWYTFEYFKDSNAQLSCREELDQLFLELSKTSWLDLSRRRKEQFGGFETIPFGQINFYPDNIELTKDTKILSFRFGAGDKFRMLGYRIERCQAFYIIGYDFNHSAYLHGR